MTSTTRQRRQDHAEQVARVVHAGARDVDDLDRVRGTTTRPVSTTAAWCGRRRLVRARGGGVGGRHATCGRRRGHKGESRQPGPFAGLLRRACTVVLRTSPAAAPRRCAICRTRSTSVTHEPARGRRRSDWRPRCPTLSAAETAAAVQRDLVGARPARGVPADPGWVHARQPAVVRDGARLDLRYLRDHRRRRRDRSSGSRSARRRVRAGGCSRASSAW